LTPVITLPVSSRGIAIIISAESWRSSPNGTPGARRRTTAVTRASNIDGAIRVIDASAQGWGIINHDLFLSNAQIRKVLSDRRADGFVAWFTYPVVTRAAGTITA
jgi:hypothetical protein